MEQNVPGPVSQSKEDGPEDACMKFYNASRPLYLEAEALGVGLRARLLQKWDDMKCTCDAVPDNETLHLISYESRSLLSTDLHYSNIECEALGILHRLEKYSVRMMPYFFTDCSTVS